MKRAVHLEPMADVRDETRTLFLQQQGITVIRFPNEVVWKNPNAIIEEILKFGKTADANSSQEEGSACGLSSIIPRVGEPSVEARSSKGTRYVARSVRPSWVEGVEVRGSMRR